MRVRRKRVERKRDREFKLPLHAQLQTPGETSPLLDFIRSCGDEVDPQEAIREYQQEWCDHPIKKQGLISTIANPTEERFEYRIACQECGLIREYKGRPPSRVRQEA